MVEVKLFLVEIELLLVEVELFGVLGIVYAMVCIGVLGFIV